jgi:hypothetical protein
MMETRRRVTNELRFNRLSLALGLFCASILWGQPSEPQTTELDQTVSAALATTGAPSASVAVVRAGQIAYAMTFGKADIEKDRPADAKTVTRSAPSASSSRLRRCSSPRRKANFRWTTRSQNITRT